MLGSGNLSERDRHESGCACCRCSQPAHLAARRPLGVQLNLAELKRNNAPIRYAGYNLVEFRNDRFISVLPRPRRDLGRFTTSGNVATFVFSAPPPAGLIAARPYVMRWSVYRDRLTWSAVPGRAFIGMFVSVPWTRAK